MLIPGYPRKLPSAGEDTRGIGGCVFAQLQPSVALFDPPWYFSAASGNKPVAVDVWLKSLAESQQLSPEWFPKPYLCSSFPFFLSFSPTELRLYHTETKHLGTQTFTISVNEPALPCPARRPQRYSVPCVCITTVKATASPAQRWDKHGPVPTSSGLIQYSSRRYSPYLSRRYW